MRPIWHVYYATKGAAGAYIDALLKASATAGVPARAFVSSQYRYSTKSITKIFFPLTDRLNKRGVVTKFLRGVELTLGYTRVLINALISRPTVCLHLIDDYYVTYIFHQTCKLLGLQTAITCHDVGSHYLGMHSIRRKMLLSADQLIVHNQSAKKSLIESFKEDITGKIVTYPFPNSSYDDIVTPEMKEVAKNTLESIVDMKNGYYLFLGVVRNSKGIESLLEAWSSVNPGGRFQLVIAGVWTDPSAKTRELASSDTSCVVIDRYLSDEEFVTLIENSRFVVLPYQNYAHSAVLNSCANHGASVITSDIEMFTELTPNTELTYKEGDTADLARVISKSMEMSPIGIENSRDQLSRTFRNHDRKLVRRLRETFLPTKGKVNTNRKIVLKRPSEQVSGGILSDVGGRLARRGTSVRVRKENIIERIDITKLPVNSGSADEDKI